MNGHSVLAKIKTGKSREVMIGELCALTSAFSFSTVNIAIRRGMKRSRDNGTFLSTFVNMIVFLILIAILYVGRYLPTLTGAGFLLFLVAGLLTTFVGRSLHYEAIRSHRSVQGHFIEDVFSDHHGMPCLSFPVRTVQRASICGGKRHHRRRVDALTGNHGAGRSARGPGWARSRDGWNPPINGRTGSTRKAVCG